MKTGKKDAQIMTIKLNASDSVVSMYMAMQQLIRTIYLSCVLRKVQRIAWTEYYSEDTKIYDVEKSERYCFPTEGEGYKCKYGYVKYSMVPAATLSTILWYAEKDAVTILRHIKRVGHPDRKTLKSYKDVYDLLHSPAFKQKSLMYNIDHSIIPIPVTKTVLLQALGNKGLHETGTFMLPIVKWDVPICPESLEYLRKHFPVITCKITNVYLYCGADDTGKMSLCVMLRYVNKFNPADINTVGQLIYNDPYVITYPKKKELYSRYPMLDSSNHYMFGKPLTFFADEITKIVQESNVTRLEAADICAKLYRDERISKAQQEKAEYDIGTIYEQFGSGYLGIKPLTF